MFSRLLRRRAEWKAAIAADSRRLMESFNERAYFEACERVRGIDGARPGAPLDRGQARDRYAARNCDRPRRRRPALNTPTLFISRLRDANLNQARRTPP